MHSADEQRTAHQAGAGDLVIDFDLVEGQPQPFTTISWRLGHAIVGVLAARSHSHFDDPEASYGTWKFAGTADEALAQLDREVERWLDGLRSVDDERMQQPCGPAEGPWGDRPFADLVLHISTARRFTIWPRSRCCGISGPIAAEAQQPAPPGFSKQSSA